MSPALAAIAAPSAAGGTLPLRSGTTTSCRTRLSTRPWARTSHCREDMCATHATRSSLPLNRGTNTVQSTLPAVGPAASQAVDSRGKTRRVGLGIRLRLGITTPLRHVHRFAASAMWLRTTRVHITLLLCLTLRSGHPRKSPSRRRWRASARRARCHDDRSPALHSLLASCPFTSRPLCHVSSRSIHAP